MTPKWLLHCVLIGNDAKRHLRLKWRQMASGNDTYTVPVTASRTAPVTASRTAPVTASRTVPVTASRTASVTASRTTLVTASRTTPVTASLECLKTTSLECLKRHQTTPFSSTRQAPKLRPSLVLQASPPSLVAAPRWCHFRAEVHLYPCWPQRHSLLSWNPNHHPPSWPPNRHRISPSRSCCGC